MLTSPSRQRQSKTKPRSCGNQPAHESLLNRRLQPCPLPWTSSSSTAPGLNQNADALLKALDGEHESRLLKKRP